MVLVKPKGIVDFEKGLARTGIDSIVSFAGGIETGYRMTTLL